MNGQRIFALSLSGYSNEEIAELTGVSVGRVKYYSAHADFDNQTGETWRNTFKCFDTYLGQSCLGLPFSLPSDTKG